MLLNVQILNTPTNLSVRNKSPTQHYVTNHSYSLVNIIKRKYNFRFLWPQCY